MKRYNVIGRVIILLFCIEFLIGQKAYSQKKEREIRIASEVALEVMSRERCGVYFEKTGRTPSRVGVRVEADADWILSRGEGTSVNEFVIEAERLKANGLDICCAEEMAGICNARICREIRILRIFVSDRSVLKLIEKFPRIVELTLPSNTMDKDLSIVLSGGIRYRFLDISRCRKLSAKGIMRASRSSESIALPKSTRNQDIENIVKERKDLVGIDLAFCDSVTNYLEISKLKELRWLGIGRMAKEEDIKRIAENARNIERLSMRGVEIRLEGVIDAFEGLCDLRVIGGRLEGLELLGELKEIEKLELCCSWERRNLDCNIFRGMNKLKRLCIDGSRIKNIGCLREIGGLKDIEMNFVDFTEEDFLKKLLMVPRLEKIKVLTDKDLKIDFRKTNASQGLREVVLESIGANPSEFNGIDRLEKAEKVRLGWCGQVPRFSRKENGKICREVAFTADNENMRLERIGNLYNVEQVYICVDENFDESGEIGICLKHLETQKNLRYIEIAAKKLRNIEVLCRLEKLWKLRVDGCKEGVDIEKMKESRSLRVLEMVNCDRLRNLENIVDIENLRELYIGYCNDIQNIEWISESRSLKRVVFEGCKNIENKDIDILKKRRPDIIVEIR